MKSLSDYFQTRINRAGQIPVKGDVVDAMAEGLSQVFNDLNAHGIRMEIDDRRAVFKKSEDYPGIFECALTVRINNERFSLGFRLVAEPLKNRSNPLNFWMEKTIPGKYVVRGGIKPEGSYLHALRDLNEPGGRAELVEDIMAISTEILGRRKQVREFKGLMNRRLR